MSIAFIQQSYSTLLLEAEQGIVTITLNRGRSNPMNGQLVRELRDAFTVASSDPEIKGLILTGQPGFFSVGLDVVELYDYDEARFLNFWHELSEMILAMIRCPKPVVAAITGHAPAGGCVLALCCDYRIMARGKYTIGLNELPVGIVIPPMIYELYRFVLGENRAYRLLIEGRLMNAEEALERDLVDEAVVQEYVLERAQTKMKDYQAINQNAWQTSKGLLRRELLLRLESQLEDFDANFKPVIDHWWRPESRHQLQRMLQRLKKA